ncbi:tyrosine-type recombinase/integrase [Butyrivibrio sp. INlla14]|uniref:tyrosine-type recombinase/integrase n=1 Tax=Butyrivibrio sp. INlla14 TaxID=1520808 RepID=UPI000876B362|nr:tyrosine-type recombinase/integrase [Butyrivibrio sp. INlla14]SCX96562.1 Site-specific recombinase XerD [Butyrivibrio sp. INlla14]
MARKDNKGRNLKEGESQRKDGTYMYRFTDPKTGKRVCKYSKDLPSLREIEKDIQHDIAVGLVVAANVKNITLNEAFERYMGMIQLEPTTRNNYLALWKNHVEDSIGNMKLVDIRASHIKTFYNQKTIAGYAWGTLKLLHGIFAPIFESALEDDIVRKSPVKGTLSGYGVKPKEKVALSNEEQDNLLEFIQGNACFNKHYPMIQFMISTALRIGELSGLTWNDIDFKAREIRIDHQLVYKNYGDGCKFHKSTPKTEAGNRTIPMTETMHRVLLMQKEQQFLLNINHDVEVDGLKNFVFTAKSGGPLAPNAVNSILYNIINKYNSLEQGKAASEKRKPELLPKISAHSLRHTGCTRMAESGMDPKVLQYIMGHKDIAITMDVYNHIADLQRVQKEMAKVDVMAVIG